MTIAERIIRVAKAAKLPVITIKHQVYSTYGININPNHEAKVLEALEREYNLV